MFYRVKTLIDVFSLFTCPECCTSVHVIWWRELYLYLCNCWFFCVYLCVHITLLYTFLMIGSWDIFDALPIGFFCKHGEFGQGTMPFKTRVIFITTANLKKPSISLSGHWANETRGFREKASRGKDEERREDKKEKEASFLTHFFCEDDRYIFLCACVK